MKIIRFKELKRFDVFMMAGVEYIVIRFEKGKTILGSNTNNNKVSYGSNGMQYVEWIGNRPPLEKPKKIWMDVAEYIMDNPTPSTVLSKEFNIPMENLSGTISAIRKRYNLITSPYSGRVIKYEIKTKE